jgi:itaconate CoA-transferase
MDPRCATNTARTANRAETDGLVARVFGQMSIEEAQTRLVSTDVAFASVNDST